MDFQDWLRLWTNLQAVSIMYLVRWHYICISGFFFKMKSWSLTIAEEVFFVVVNFTRDSIGVPHLGWNQWELLRINLHCTGNTFLFMVILSFLCQCSSYCAEVNECVNG